MYNIDPYGTIIYNGVEVPTILCHYDAYHLGLGSNHGDVYNWFKKHNKTMDDVRKDVAALMKTPAQNTPTQNVPTQNTTTKPESTKEIYRVRKAWNKPETQIGAFAVLDYAKSACDKAGKGYYVFNSNGEVIYPINTKKSILEIAKEVINGKWLTGAARKNKLTEAGYDYNEVQSAVNDLLGAKSNKKTVEQIAKEVINGKWGNGTARKKKLEEAGYDYKAVQAKVNELLRK